MSVRWYRACRMSMLARHAAARRVGLGALVSLCVLVLAAAPAGAVIVYVCGPDNNLCRINSDGSHQSQLTTDATASANLYQTPSLSHDGSKLAFIQGNAAYSSAQDATGRINLNAGDDVLTVMRPDGGRVAVINEQSEGSGLVPWLAEVNLDSSNFIQDSRAVLTTGYLGDSVLRDGFSATSHACNPGSGNCAAYSICEIDSNGGCTRNVADDPLRDLWEPAGSPDGSMVAVMAVPYPQGSSAHPAPSGGDIALYDAATGAFIRNLTNGPADSQPTWSPDGSQIAFARGNAIYVISLKGAPGSERLLTHGSSPTWGGPDISTGNAGQHTLTVSLAGNGKGAVTGSSIRCPSACTHSYATGTSVTLTAAPAAGSRFSGWSGACAGGGACTVRMSSDRSVTASFALGSTPARPSHTKITKSKINAMKHTASFSFSAKGARSFRCELIPQTKKGHKKPKVKFSSCKSPKRYSHLKAGNYTFVVEGVDSAGADRHPASKTFKIA
jgi:Divergent InlB B-repeat domain/WD40-like Beta Propeller Repeat